MVELIVLLFYDHSHLNDLIETNEVKIVLLHIEYNILNLREKKYIVDYDDAFLINLLSKTEL
jgi:hypothetical protein